MATKKNPNPRATAKFPAPAHKSGEELVTLTRQTVQGIQASPGYGSQQAVQAASTALLTATDSYEKTLQSIAQKRAELESLMGVRDTQLSTLILGRQNLERTVTTVANGSAAAIQALNVPVTQKAAAAPSTEAPTHLVLKNDKTTPGRVLAKCKAVPGAGSYVFVFTTDPTALPGVGTTVVATKARCTLSGQPLGHVLLVRCAAVRKVGGQSLWSEPVQVLVR